MKKSLKITSIILMLLLALLILPSCFMPKSRRETVILTLGGYEREEFYSSGGIQDFTDYGKYYFAEMPKFEENEYFVPVTSNDIEVLYGYIDNFDSWIEAYINPSTKNEKALVENYDLDRTIINEGDYFYIYDKMGEPIGESQYEQYECYDVYIFDTESCTLYYFHNNI
ncbi:MAG: hypothetical protein J6A90_05590 [Clostridia bacterium]|nr:hypothetical protein [Clostridia bacterium]